MKNLEYDFKGRKYFGSIHLDENSGVWYGEILDIQGLVTYEADNLLDLEFEFMKAVEDWREGRWKS